VKEQEAPSSQVHVPLAQVAVQVEPPLHSAWQGGAEQPRLHDAPDGQTQVPLEQSAETLELHAASTATAVRTAPRPRMGQDQRITFAAMRRAPGAIPRRANRRFRWWFQWLYRWSFRWWYRSWFRWWC
jgi:hypothetical protein